MRVLAIDTALEACAVAVFNAERGIFLATETVMMPRGHAEALMPMVARVMDAAGIEFADLDRIAVTVGPGSFTGLRVGVSAARGIALASGRRAIGLSTLAAFAAPYVTIDDNASIVSAIDARHAQVYLQVIGGGGRTLVAPRVATIHDAVRSAGAGPVRLVGSAAGLLAAEWPANEPPPLLVETRPAPDIEWVARLGAAAHDTGVPPKPLYLRVPDARPQEGGRLARR